MKYDHWNANVLYKWCDYLADTAFIQWPNFVCTFSLLDCCSIIGLYVSLVLVIGRFVRVFFSGASTQVMYQELPCVDNILNLCLDIYMVRESQDYRMEEYLFSKLIFLYRSPETLIKWTKLKYSWSFRYWIFSLTNSAKILFNLNKISYLKWLPLSQYLRGFRMLGYVCIYLGCSNFNGILKAVWVLVNILNRWDW